MTIFCCIPYGEASYNAGSRTYNASRRLARNTFYQMRFPGDPAYKGTASRSVQVRSRAYLSRPVAPSKVKRGGRFTVCYLKPYIPAGGFYHYRNGKWRFYKTVYAANRQYNGFTRYFGRYRLPYTGRWYVRAYHGDESHAATWSPREVLRVAE